MQNLRFFLLLLSITVALAMALVLPLPGRADDPLPDPTSGPPRR